MEYLKIPFVNIFLIKHATQMIALFFALLQTKALPKNSVIITYNPYMELAIPALIFCKLRKVKCICLVADIPITIPKNYSIFKKWLRKLEIKNYYRFIGQYNGLIVLNQNIIKTFAPGTPYYLMDGGVSTEEIEASKVLPPKNHELNRILFTGALEPYNGIPELMTAFRKISRGNLELMICGNGSLKSTVIEATQKDQRIKYMGTVSNDDSRKYQQSAGLLISTRPTDQFAMKLTFPSKILEYMLSGTPVLSTRLNGLNGGYENCMFFTGQTSDEIALGIENYYDMPVQKRFEKAEIAYAYVTKQKNYISHCPHILRLVEKVLNK